LGKETLAVPKKENRRRKTPGKTIDRDFQFKNSSAEPEEKCGGHTGLRTPKFKGKVVVPGTERLQTGW